MTTHEQSLSPRTPIMVFGALIILTIATVLLSGLDVGNTGALLIAMSVASIKAALVLYFFMHLNHEPLIFKLFLGVAFFTLLAIFVLTFSDYSFRVI
ncbi:MAG: cytochrome C oxidase subunit IV family protein [FCB group bacterium]|nr:cytochrome C oxidase subunit IV family protein [FCB group bacterium]MBL7027308.1 cytochrome C oxidase subunit IV family protein [Candidatus Neomarinimicrobiota bacterium]MBL7122278.1 cytochrome C oxidase subunit IV family protein [Candidatus Neomarinimicrobiota bacterium]